MTDLAQRMMGAVDAGATTASFTALDSGLPHVIIYQGEAYAEGTGDSPEEAMTMALDKWAS